MGPSPEPLREVIPGIPGRGDSEPSSAAPTPSARVGPVVELNSGDQQASTKGSTAASDADVPGGDASSSNGLVIGVSAVVVLFVVTLAVLGVRKVRMLSKKRKQHSPNANHPT